jgi:predicted neutral ceramidase superfamily lipid hydrolase
MGRDLVPHNKPVFDQLHSSIYGVAACLVAWFVISAWALFDRGGYTNLSLAFVSLLLLVAVVLPWRLFVVWKRHRLPLERPSQNQQKTSLRDWSAGNFEVWGASLHGSHAAIDALLPLAAVAFGLTAIGIVFVIVSASVP